MQHYKPVESLCDDARGCHGIDADVLMAKHSLREEYKNWDSLIRTQAKLWSKRRSFIWPK
jgi:hypothetical protein